MAARSSNDFQSILEEMAVHLVKGSLINWFDENPAFILSHGDYCRSVVIDQR